MKDLFNRKKVTKLEAEKAELQEQVKELELKVSIYETVESKLEMMNGMIGTDNITASSLLPSMKREGVAILVDDYYGGKVFEHVATKLVVLDENGNASYSKTAKKADKGFNYRLQRKSEAQS